MQRNPKKPIAYIIKLLYNNQKHGFGGGILLTIYDIAKAANVSASSVSRVINGKSGVNNATRQKILQILKENNYVPNEAARILVNQSSRLIGILIADIRNLHHMEGAYYIQSEMDKNGYNGMIINAGYDAKGLAHAMENLNQRRVEGVVLMGSVFQNRDTEKAVRQYLPEIPIIMINGQLDIPNCYSVLSQEKEGIFTCVEFLANHGRKQIAYITNAPTPSNLLKQNGFSEGIAAQRKNGVRGWIYKDDRDDSLKGGYEAMQRALLEHPDVDAVICAVDLLAAGALQALLEKDVDVPRKVAIIGVDNSIYGQICYPRLTSLDNQIFSSCVIGAHQLLEFLQGGHPARCVSMQTVLVERETT